MGGLQQDRILLLVLRIDQIRPFKKINTVYKKYNFGNGLCHEILYLAKLPGGSLQKEMFS